MIMTFTLDFIYVAITNKPESGNLSCNPVATLGSSFPNQIMYRMNTICYSL